MLDELWPEYQAEYLSEEPFGHLCHLEQSHYPEDDVMVSNAENEEVVEETELAFVE